jgi:putative endonuclease
MFTVYILQSQISLRYYIGYTSNLAERLLRHNAGRNKFTKNERPWIVVYQEQYPTRAQAMRREKQIKSYKGGNAFKTLFQ